LQSSRTQTSFTEESGYSDFKRKAKIDSNTVFAIGSISKQFTAVSDSSSDGTGKTERQR
jgi:hypothetical protein